MKMKRRARHGWRDAIKSESGTDAEREKQSGSENTAKAEREKTDRVKEAQSGDAL